MHVLVCGQVMMGQRLDMLFVDMIGALLGMSGALLGILGALLGMLRGIITCLISLRPVMSWISVITLGHSWYKLTCIHYHDGCRWPGATLAPGHQQFSWWIGFDHSVTWIILCNRQKITANKQTVSERCGEVINTFFFFLGRLIPSEW